MSLRRAYLAIIASACVGGTGCSKSAPDPADGLREFAAMAFARASSDNRLTAEFQLEPPRVLAAKSDSLVAPPTAEVVVNAVDRVIKGDDVADWIVEKRDRVKGGGKGRIKLARDAGDDGRRNFVFVYAYQNGAWLLKEQKCNGRGFMPEELKRYFELAAPAAPAP